MIRFRIDFGDACNVGPGKIALLEAVQRGGSLSQAARGLKMSYRRAWLLLDSLNHSFDDAVTIATAGGKNGGGAQVTPFGNALIESYRALEREITRVGAQRLRELAPRVASASPPARVARKPLARRSRGG